MQALVHCAYLCCCIVHEVKGCFHQHLLGLDIIVEGEGTRGASRAVRCRIVRAKRAGLTVLVARVPCQSLMTNAMENSCISQRTWPHQRGGTAWSTKAVRGAKVTGRAVGVGSAGRLRRGLVNSYHDHTPRSKTFIVTGREKRW